MSEQKHLHSHTCECRDHKHEEHTCKCHDHKHEEHTCQCHWEEEQHDHACGCHGHRHTHSCGCHEHHEDNSCGCGCGHDHGKEGTVKDWLIPLIGLCCLIALSPISLPWNWLKVVLYGAVYLLVGHEVLLESAKHIAKGKVFDENFLMAVASLGAFFIGDYAEAIAVMIFYNIGEYCQNAAVRRSKKSVSDLMDIRPDYANWLIDGAEKRVDPAQVPVGDLILLRPGEKIPRH